MIEIDGAWGEGGGQLVRTAIALSAITGRPVRVRNVRAARRPPGLAPQHLAAVRAVAALCDAATSGVQLRATQFEFAPRRLRGADFRFDVGTAGSVTLLAQALLPVLAHASPASRVTLIGGTDVRAAPPLDYLRRVFLAHLAALGVRVRCELRRRGYYPRGGGEIELEVTPARPRAHRFAGASAGPIAGCAHTDQLPAHIAARMAESARARLPRPARIALEVGADSASAGGAIVLWTEGPTVLGAGRVAERGVRAEALGEAVGAELAADLDAGAALDLHAADQVLVWLALADGESTFTVREVTLHARTAMWLIEQFLPVQFAVEAVAPIVRVRVQPGETRPRLRDRHAVA